MGLSKVPGIRCRSPWTAINCPFSDFGPSLPVSSDLDDLLQKPVEKFKMITNWPGKFEGAVKLCSHIKPEILIVSFRFTVHDTDHAIPDPYYPDHLSDF